jgi:hypothetical protein
MKPSRLPHLSLFSVLVLSAATLAASAAEPQSSGGLDTARIEMLTGAKGALDAKTGVFKVSVPRKDLAVQVGGARLNPRLGLTSWAAFVRAGESAMVMGDIVVTETEVDPVMSAALDAGLEVTALHNHFLGDEPRVMFMHIGGPQGAAQGGDLRRRAAQPHDRRGAAGRLPPFLGDRPGRRPRPRPAFGSRCAGRGRAVRFPATGAASCGSRPGKDPGRLKAPAQA